MVLMALRAMTAPGQRPSRLRIVERYIGGRGRGGPEPFDGLTCGAGRGGRYFHPYQHPADQTLASTKNETRSSSVIFLDSEGEEVEEEEESFVGSNDDHHRSICIEHLFNRIIIIFDINERYAKSLIQQEIRALEHENLWLQNQCQRLNAQLRRCMTLLTS